MFEFNPELVQGDDDDADDETYEREDQEETEVRKFIKGGQLFLLLRCFMVKSFFLQPLSLLSRIFTTKNNCETSRILKTGFGRQKV